MKPTEYSFSGTDLSAWCPHFDHHDPALTHDNVYQVYEHLRQECPVAWSDQYGGFWVVSRYADIVTALMDPVTFSSAEGVHIPRQEGQMKSIPIDYDPPLHTRYRKIFNDALNLHLIRSREPVIRSVIVQLLAPIAARGGGELASELAIQLPIQVISGMLGLKAHTTSRIRTITEQMWMTFGKERDPAPLHELFALLMDEVNERRIHPQNDLITQFVTLTIEGRLLTDEEPHYFTKNRTRRSDFLLFFSPCEIPNVALHRFRVCFWQRERIDLRRWTVRFLGSRLFGLAARLRD